jgi:uncharacterized RDD family membrane protein YckC
VTHGAAAGSESPRVFASLRARFAAGLIDLAVITVLSLVISSIFAKVPGRAADAVVTAFVSAYFILSYSAAGRGYSIGKRLLGIRVVNRLGEPLTLTKATVRWFISIGIALPLAVLVIGFERGAPVRTGPAFAIAVPILCVVIVDSYMCAANEAGHRSLHDIAAGSYVVRRGHAGEVPATKPLARSHYIGMALCCLGVALWFSWVYVVARDGGARSGNHERPRRRARIAQGERALRGSGVRGARRRHGLGGGGDCVDTRQPAH